MFTLNCQNKKLQQIIEKCSNKEGKYLNKKTLYINGLMLTN